MRPYITNTALVVAVLAGFALAAQTRPAASTPKKPAPANPVKSGAKAGAKAAAKSTSNSAPASPAAKKTTTAKSAAPPLRHYSQQQPTTDRFKEIQQALADRGYFKGQVDGQWGQESAEALKQFQREQRIDEDGKINSLSLIALGLGPHRNVAENQSARSTIPSPRPAAPAPGESVKTDAVQAEVSAASANAEPSNP